MPIYEYTCKACGAESELMQKLSDPPAKVCPVCHKKKLVKNMSASGFRLGGGGWYETDFKSGSKKNVAGDKVEKPASAPTSASASEKPASTAKAETAGKKESATRKDSTTKASSTAGA